MQKGVLGSIRKMVVHDGHAGPVAIGVQPEFLDWLSDPVRNGAGALMDFGCYGADLMTWLMKGERPLTVTAVTQQLQPKLYPKRRRRGHDRPRLRVRAGHHPGVVELAVRPQGHVRLRGARLHLRPRQPAQSAPGAPTAEKETEAPDLPAPGHDPFHYFAAVVRGELRPAPTDLGALELNVTVMDILDAARESARTGRTVTLAR